MLFLNDGLITAKKAGAAKAILLFLPDNWIETKKKKLKKTKFFSGEMEGCLRNYESKVGFGFPFELRNVKLMGVLSLYSCLFLLASSLSSYIEGEVV